MPTVPVFTRITTHIYKLNLEWELPIPFGPKIPTAVWLIDEGEQWTLIDSGPPDYEQIVPAAIQEHISQKPLARLLLTHGHLDHVSSLLSLRERWPILPVWAHAAEVPFVAGSMRYHELSSNNLIFNLMKRRLQESGLRFQEVGALAEDAYVAGMSVHHAPGHTPGQVAFLHEEDRALICADAFMNLNNKLAPPLRVSSYDLIAARQSMRMLAELEFDLLLPSHDPGNGVPREDVQRRLPKLI